MSYSPQPGPPLPPPWHAEWDQRAQRWLFINPQTGQRTFDHPHPNQQPGYGGPPQGYGGPPQGYSGPPPGYGGPPQGYGGHPPGYGGPPQGYAGPPQGYGGPPQGYGGPPPAAGYGRGSPPQQSPPPQQHKDHSGLKYGALGAVAGIAAGAFAMHEGDKIRGSSRHSCYTEVCLY